MGTPGDGAVYSLLSRGDTLYAGTQFDLIRSTDNGATWALKDAGLTTSQVPALSLAASGDVLLAGSSSAGVYRSTDFGNTWAAANDGLPPFARSDAIVYALGGTFYLGIGGSGSKGFYVSTNGGVLWDTLAGGPAAPVTAMAGWGDSLLAGDGNGRTFFSADHGQSWRMVPLSSTSSPGIRNIAKLGGDLFASTGGDGIFRSTDAGVTWEPVNNGFTDNPVWARPLAVVDTFLFTGVDYSGNGGVWRSSTRGASWENVSGERMTRTTFPPIGTVDVYFSQYAMAAHGTTLFAGTFGYGLFKSTDLGSTWTQIAVPFRYVYLPALLCLGDTLLAGGPGIEAIYVSADRGLHWEGYWKNLLVGATSFARGNGPELLASVTATTFGRGVYASTDGGVNWTRRSNGLPSATNNRVVTDGGVLYSATDAGLFTSTDNGAQWTSTSWTGNAVGIYANGSTLIVGKISPQRTYRSTNGGATWDSLGGGLPLNFAARTFARIGTSIFMCGTGSSATLFRSTDDGANWSNVTGATSAVQVLADGNTLWVNGITPFYSTNSGQSWNPISLTGVPSAFSAIAVGGGFLYGVRGGSGQSGVFRRDISGLVDVESSEADVPSAFHLAQNYPNPFNPSTTIGFQIPSAGYVTIRVFDLLGRDVVTLIDGPLAAGRHEVHFNAEQMPSGPYFYRLSAGGTVRVGRMIYLK